MYIYCIHVRSHMPSLGKYDCLSRPLTLSLSVRSVVPYWHLRQKPAASLLRSLRSRIKTSVSASQAIGYGIRTHIMISYSLKRANFAPSCLNAAMSVSILDLANLPLLNSLKV